MYVDRWREWKGRVERAQARGWRKQACRRGERRVLQEIEAKGRVRAPNIFFVKMVLDIQHLTYERYNPKVQNNTNNFHLNIFFCCCVFWLTLLQFYLYFGLNPIHLVSIFKCSVLNVGLLPPQPDSRSMWGRQLSFAWTSQKEMLLSDPGATENTQINSIKDPVSYSQGSIHSKHACVCLCSCASICSAIHHLHTSSFVITLSANCFLQLESARKQL